MGDRVDRGGRRGHTGQMRGFAPRPSPDALRSGYRCITLRYTCAWALSRAIRFTSRLLSPFSSRPLAVGGPPCSAARFLYIFLMVRSRILTAPLHARRTLSVVVM